MMIQNKLNYILDSSERIFKTDTRYLIKGGFWITIGQIISSISAFVLAITYANWLSPETYGTYKYVLAVMSILSIPTLNGLSTAVTQAVAIGKEGSIRSMIRIKIRWGLIGSVGSLGLALYYYLNANYDLSLAFTLTGIFIPIFETFGIYNSLFNGRGEIKRSTIFYIIGQMISTTAILITLYFNQTLGIILFIYLFTWTLTRAILLKYTLAKYQINKIETEETLRYGKHLTAISAFNTVANYLDKILLFHFAGATTLSIYAITQAPLDQIKSLASRGISTLAFPKYATKGRADLEDHIFLWIKRSLVILTAVTIAYIIFIPWIFPLVFPIYAENVWYSQLAAIGLIPLASFIPYTALNAKVMKKQLYQLNFSSAGFQILTMCILGYIYGLVGIIISRILARFFDLITGYILVKKYSKR